MKRLLFASLAAFAIGAGAVLELERRIGRALARAINP